MDRVCVNEGIYISILIPFLFDLKSSRRSSRCDIHDCQCLCVCGRLLHTLCKFGQCCVSCTYIIVSYLTVIGMHKMQGRVYPNYCQTTIFSLLLIVASLLSWDYLVMTHPLLIAGNLPIKTLVRRQLPTNPHTCAWFVYIHTLTQPSYIRMS